MTTTPRFHWWTSITLLAICGAEAVVFWGPRKSLATAPRRPEDHNVLRVVYTQNLRPDPHRRIFPLPQYNELILSLWESLVECDPATSLPQPAAAASWQWSPDQLNLTLRLRQDARWSNGDAVTAHDFVRGWRRLLRQDMTVAQTLFPLRNAEAYQQGRLKDFQGVGVRALDDYTLKLELERPRSTLVVELADPLLAPLHQTTERVLASEAYLRVPSVLISNGPFRLVRANGDGFKLEANRYYHDYAGIRLAGVDFIRADNLSTAPLLLAAGVADLLSPTPFGRARVMPTERRIDLEPELVLGVSVLNFNVSRGPLHDVRVRQALALALDRAGPIRKYDPGHMVAAWSWVPTMPGREGLVLLKEDAVEARRLLAAAGYPDGKGFPVLRIALPLWSEGDPFPAAWSERWFQELGIRAYLAYETGPKWGARLLAGDYDVLYGTLAATVPDPGDLLSGFLQPLEYNSTKWMDKDVLQLLSEANSLRGSARLAALEKAERLVIAAVPSVPVMFERRQTMRAAEVQGWYPDPLARQSLRRLWLEAPPLQNFGSPAGL